MANEPTNDPKVPPLVDNPGAPEIFADGPVGVSFDNGCIRLTFASFRLDHNHDPASTSRVVTCRVVLPAPGALALRELLVDFLGKLEAQAAVEAASGMTKTLQ